MTRRYDVDITLRRSVDLSKVSGTTDIYTNGRQDYKVVQPTVDITTVSGVSTIVPGIDTEFFI